MLNTRFEEYKLKRELKRNGTEVTFYRNKKNAFGEHVGELEVVAKLTGLYHETNGYVSLSVSDATVQRSVKLPMLLCLNDDVKAAGLGDERAQLILNEFKSNGIDLTRLAKD